MLSSKYDFLLKNYGLIQDGGDRETHWTVTVLIKNGLLFIAFMLVKNAAKWREMDRNS